MTYDATLTIEQVRAVNRAAGGSFFDADAMRFFDSRVHDAVYGGRFFVTSEQFVQSDGTKHPRRYSVREIDAAGSVWTVGTFQQYATSREAHAAARDLASDDAQRGFDVKLCSDCVYRDANGDDGEAPTDYEGLLPEWSGYVFSMIRNGHGDAECFFGKSPCDGCGTGLAGDRWDYRAVQHTSDARTGGRVDA